MMSPNVIQLRQMLSEKFPGARWNWAEAPAAESHWPTGLPQIDEPLRGGLPQGALAEIVCAGSGSATLIRELLARAAGQKQIVTLIDGNDSLDVAPIEKTVLSRLLWIRCHSADEALKAADLVLRDGNLSLVLFDLKLNPPRQLRKIPATTWYRFQRLVEETATVCVVFTPHAMVSPAQTRMVLSSGFSLDSVESPAAELARELKLEISDAQAAAPLAIKRAV
jgi:hypothetical protein